MNLPAIFILAILAAAALAGCAGPYQAPVVERTVTRPSPAAAAPSARPAAPTYTVKRGDTLYSIALDNGLDYQELAAWNNIGDPSAIKPGAVLRMRPPAPAVVAALPPPGEHAAPPSGGVQVQPAIVPGAVEARPLGGEARAGAEPARPAGEVRKTEPRTAKPPYSDENVAMLPRPPTPKTEIGPELAPSPPASGADGPDSVAWMWPATGRVLAGFSEAVNKGVDIVGKIGDPVVASASGRVVYSGTGLRGYGKLVIIKHNQTYLSAYAHNSNLLVKEGQNVVRGQKIAEIGDTDSSQSKLHFEIRRLGKPVDPLKFLPDRPS
ncbi:MAG: peptidoglycan DD-metalloendopeptidase family protein [Burkholderiales bacterium]